jgi:hypothetical protein
MALDSKNFIKKVFVNAKLTSNLANTVVARPDTIPAGLVVVTDLSNKILDDTESASAKRIKIVQGRGANNPLLQFELDIDSIKNYSGAAHVASQEQITYFGYNGASGAIDIAPAATSPFTYLYKLTPQNNTMIDGLRPTNIVNIMAEVGAGATQATAANIALKQFLAKFKFHKAIDWRVKIEMVSDNAGVNTGVIGVTVVGAANSRTLTFGAGVGPAIVAGDFIRIGAGTTVGVYKVASSTRAVDTAGVVTLETPLQENVNLLGTTTSLIVAANAATAAFGIKLTGIRQKYDVVRWRQYDKVRFAAAVVQGGTTPVTYSQNATEGTGMYEQAANDEYISWGDEGQYNPMQLPPLNREQDVVYDTPYSVLNINWENDIKGPIAGFGQLKGQTILYLDKTGGTFGTGTQGNAAFTSVVDVLDEWVKQKGFADATI